MIETLGGEETPVIRLGESRKLYIGVKKEDRNLFGGAISLDEKIFNPEYKITTLRSQKMPSELAEIAHKRFGVGYNSIGNDSIVPISGTEKQIKALIEDLEKKPDDYSPNNGHFVIIRDYKPSKIS